MQKYNTKQISEIKAILKLLPISGTVFLLGLFAIAGTPPFSVFASELSIMVSLFTAKKFVVGGALALLLAIIFAGIAVTLFKMFYGNNQEEELQPGETNKAGTIVIVVLFLVISISGLFIPDELKNLITQAQNIIIGA